MSELKPCPFCGGVAQVNTWTMHGITESRCFCPNPDCPNSVRTVALATWNTRPIEDALNARIAKLEAERRWIPVSERLPENGGEYWVWFDDDFTGIKTSGYCDYSKQNGWDNTERVTHWLPLPEPPEVQG